MTFGNPQFLYALLAIPLLIVLLLWAAYRRRSALRRIGDPGLVERLSNSVNWRGRRLQTALWLIAIALTLFALARPQWGSNIELLERQGAQIMLVLDVSQSMLSEDLRPDRLTRAKLEIEDLLNRLGGDEVGLVLFAGSSFIQFPLTSDYTTALLFMDNANPGAISRPGTAIGDAINTAMQGFEPRRPNQKVMIIMTDGESHEGDVLEAARAAAAEEVLIYTVGFGSPQGAPVPDYDEHGEVIGFKKDQNGQPVLSYLDEATLQEIAQIGGGRYYRASSGPVIESLLNNLTNLQRTKIESTFETRQVERYQGFLFAALVALIIAEWIPERARSRGASTA